MTAEPTDLNAERRKLIAELRGAALAFRMFGLDWPKGVTVGEPKPAALRAIDDRGAG